MNVRRFLNLIAIYVLFGFVSFPIRIATVYATNEFSVSHKIEYHAQPTGIMRVKQNITITNALGNVYATQYALTIYSENISNINAWGDSGQLEVKNERLSGLSKITVIFDKPALGKDKSYTFSIDYTSNDLIRLNGQIKEITLPKIANAGEIDKLEARVFTPQNFGKLSFSSPAPYSTKNSENLNEHLFTKEQLLYTGARLIFGDLQVFDFTIAYHLENTGNKTGWTQIAIPPDTAYQKMIYKNVSPKPRSLDVDADGNWLAKYYLSAGEKLNINAVGKAMLYTTPRPDYVNPSAQSLAFNLKPQKYWESDNALIFQAAKNLNSARDINKYVTRLLDYDVSRINEKTVRMGALWAVNNPANATCSEFTDLFIAIARAAEIPAREINGYAYSSNEALKPIGLVADVLHSWPEYWDSQTKRWVPLDPTWEKTSGIDFFGKSDLNHFVFVIHGQNSAYPFPAGAYKAGGVDNKDVEVSFGKYDQESAPKFEIIYNFPNKIIPLFWQTKGEIIIKNLSQSALYQLIVDSSSQKTEIVFTNGNSIEVLLPYSEVKMPIIIKNKRLLAAGRDIITLRFANQSFNHEIRLLPGLAIILILLVTIALMIAVTLSLTKH